MEQVTIVGIDLAKRSFQLHGAGVDGSVVFRRKRSREKLLDFLASQPRCVVAMEACAGAHQWGREIGQLGHEVRLLPPVYVKPFVKRHKNDTADAEAICEAAQRPTMRFAAVKTEEQQARGMLFHTRDLPGTGFRNRSSIRPRRPRPLRFNRHCPLSNSAPNTPRSSADGYDRRDNGHLKLLAPEALPACPFCRKPGTQFMQAVTV